MNRTDNFELIKHPKNGKNCFVITVNNLTDYNKLKNSDLWPNNAFKSGVTLEIIPPNLSVMILGVHKKLQIQDSKLVSEMCKRHGLTSLERIMIGQESINKCQANVKR